MHSTWRHWTRSHRAGSCRISKWNYPAGGFKGVSPTVLCPKEVGNRTAPCSNMNIFFVFVNVPHMGRKNKTAFWTHFLGRVWRGSGQNEASVSPIYSLLPLTWNSFCFGREYFHPYVESIQSRFVGLRDIYAYKLRAHGGEGRGGNAREMGRTRDNNVRGTFYWRGRNRYFRPTSQFLLEHRGGAAACLPRSPSTDDRGKGRLFSFNLFFCARGGWEHNCQPTKRYSRKCFTGLDPPCEKRTRASAPVERKGEKRQHGIRHQRSAFIILVGRGATIARDLNERISMRNLNWNAKKYKIIPN